MEESEPPLAKTCRQCAGEIPIKARLCAACNSFQDWRGHVALSNTVVALLLACLSVTSLSLPALAQLFWINDSEVRITHPVIRDDILYMMATNTGNRPGVIEGASISGSIVANSLTEVRPVSPGDTFIRPGSQQIAFRLFPKLNELNAYSKSLEAFSSQNYDKNIAIVLLEIRQARGSVSYQKIPLTGRNIYEFFDFHAENCEENPEKSTFRNGCLNFDQHLRQINKDVNGEIIELQSPSKK